jgi:hypothetical protein
MGGAAWQGRVYEGPQPNRSWWPFSRERVYHGPLGAGLFQSVYSPHGPWWAGLVVSPESHLVTASLAATAGTMAAAGLATWVVAAALAALGVTATVARCLAAGVQMTALDRLSGAAKAKRVLGVAKLHFLQPWARWWGRVTGMAEWRRRHAWPRHAEGSLWSGWDRRDEWLTELTRLLRETGMEVTPDEHWGRHDLKIAAYPGCKAYLQSVVEHQSQIRFRARVRSTGRLLLAQGTLLALMGVTLAVPPLYPLLLPLAGCFVTLHREKRRMTATLASLGRKAGEILGMVPLDQEVTAQDVAASAPASQTRRLQS